ncbi:MAG: hypothetical protein R3D27_04320 [Hyphomicrobiaceae bacterium]
MAYRYDHVRKQVGGQRHDGLRLLSPGSALALAVAVLAVGGCASSAGTLPAASLATAPKASGAGAFLATLGADEQARFVAWYQADQAHARALDAFWADVEAKRQARRARIRAGQAPDDADYVNAYPPGYEGPKLSPSLQERWDRFKRRGAEDRERDPIPGVAEMLAAARSHFGFAPDRISEAEFKLRYAREALALGLGKEQVVRVYALETGGNGTADMQAGIHPLTGKGRPISSALGYAQLLHANSVGMIVKHGDTFVARLRDLEREARGDAGRVARLRTKRAALSRMLTAARRVPDQWSAHVAFGRTPQGLGIHALNIDGDIGPWLQTTKLRGIVDFAARSGRTGLTSEELELMNLAGPGTGIEMMTPAGRRAANVNFFSRQGYERNSVVRGRTAGELIAELGRRMDDGERNPGAREFAVAFDKAVAQKARVVRR